EIPTIRRRLRSTLEPSISQATAALPRAVICFSAVSALSMSSRVFPLTSAISAFHVPETVLPRIRAVQVPCRRLGNFRADQVPSRMIRPLSLRSIQEPRAAALHDRDIAGLL